MYYRISVFLCIFVTEGYEKVIKWFRKSNLRRLYYEYQFATYDDIIEIDNVYVLFIILHFGVY